MGEAANKRTITTATNNNINNNENENRLNVKNSRKKNRIRKNYRRTKRKIRIKRRIGGKIERATMTRTTIGKEKVMSKRRNIKDTRKKK